MIFRNILALSFASIAAGQASSSNLRLEGNQCTLNHGLSQVSSEIPIIIDALPADGEGLFDVTFTGPPFAPQGETLTVPAWCVDFDRLMGSGFYNADVFSTYLNDFHSDAVDKPENLKKVNWLLNTYRIGDIYDDGEGCSGVITREEYQGAIWSIVDHDNGEGSSREECIVDGLAAEAEDYDPACASDDDQLAVMLVVDNENDVIQKQVIVAEVPLVRSNICVCTETGGSFGDPHLKTWTGEKYDFHGICDLVLLENKGFANGLGMDIHMRTSKTKQWSYISTAVLRIGNDTLEIEGKTNQYWLNGVAGAFLEDGISGYPITSYRVNSKQYEFVVDLGESGSVTFKTFKDMIRIDVSAMSAQDFNGSLGMMGSYGKGLRLGRDKTTIIEDPIAFGLEWQVLANEPMLFHKVEGPQAPATCEMPTATSVERRRLREVTVSLEDAEMACSRVSLTERDQCIFDVLATNDKELAGAY